MNSKSVRQNKENNEWWKDKRFVKELDNRYEAWKLELIKDLLWLK